MKTFKELRSRLNEDFIQRALTRMGVKTQPYAVDTMPRVTATPENIAAYEQEKKDAQAYVNRYGGVKVVQDPRELEAYSNDPLASTKPIPAEFITDPGPGGVGSLERERTARRLKREVESGVDSKERERKARDLKKATAAQARFSQMAAKQGADANRRAAEKEIARTTSDLQTSRIIGKEIASKLGSQIQTTRDRGEALSQTQSTLTQTQAERDRAQAERDKAQSELDAARNQLSIQADQILAGQKEQEATKASLDDTAEQLRSVLSQNLALNRLLSQSQGQ